MKRWTYTVRGGLTFPLDMLRYDCSYPVDQASVIAMDNAERGEHKEVTLRSLVGPPSKERWSSFGWRVIKEEQERR